MVRSLLVILMVLSERIIQAYGPRTIHPYGVKLCALRCKRNKLCSNLEFDEIRLECKIFSNGTSKQASGEKDPCAPMRKYFENGNITVPRKSATTTFYESCINGNLDEVKRLVCNGLVDIDYQNDEDETCVMHVVKRNYSEIFDFLVKKRCDLSLVDEHENSVLHHACDGGNTDIVKRLIDDFNLDIHLKNRWGNTPLMCVKDAKLLELMKDRGADFTLTNDYIENILHLTCVSADIDAVRFILSLKIIDIEEIDDNGLTPIMIAVNRENSTEFVDILHGEYNASLTKCDYFGNNLFHIACRNKNLDLLKFLLNKRELKGFEQRENNNGNTPLEVARSSGNYDLVSFLRSLEYKT